jgi:hypothetical protein
MPADPFTGDCLRVTSTPGRRTIRVDLDLGPGVEPIGGQVRDDHGVAHPFSGWLDLIQLLERVRINGAPGASELSPGEGEN